MKLKNYEVRNASRHFFHGFRENATNKFFEFIYSKEKQIDETNNESSVSEKKINDQMNIPNIFGKSKLKFEDVSKNYLMKKENFNLNEKKVVNKLNNDHSKNNDYFKIKNKEIYLLNNNLIDDEKKKGSIISNKPLRCFSDGRTHNFSDIFERKSNVIFPTMKIHAETLRKCFESIKEERDKKERDNMMENANKNGEIEIPDLQYLEKVKKRVKNIVKKDQKNSS